MLQATRRSNHLILHPGILEFFVVRKFIWGNAISVVISSDFFHDRPATPGSGLVAIFIHQTQKEQDISHVQVIGQPDIKIDIFRCIAIPPKKDIAADRYGLD